MIDLALAEFGVTIRAAIALIFLTAAIGKIRNWTAFEGVVANYRLLPDRLVKPVALALPPFELAIAIALPFGAAIVDWAAASLLLLFGMAMGLNLARGRDHIDCGCFQSALRQKLRWVLVVRNGLLALSLAPASLFAWSHPSLAQLAEGSFAGAVLFITLQSFAIFWSITPAWRRAVSHHGGSGQ